MKRRVLSKTTPFHAIKKKEENNVVLSDPVPLSSSPRRAAGEDRNFCLFHLFLPRVHTPPHNENPAKLSLQTMPIGRQVRRRGRVGRHRSPRTAIGRR